MRRSPLRSELPPEGTAGLGAAGLRRTGITPFTQSLSVSQYIHTHLLLPRAKISSEDSLLIDVVEEGLDTPAAAADLGGAAGLAGDPDVGEDMVDGADGGGVVVTDGLGEDEYPDGRDAEDDVEEYDGGTISFSPLVMTSAIIRMMTIRKMKNIPIMIHYLTLLDKFVPDAAQPVIPHRVSHALLAVGRSSGESDSILRIRSASAPGTEPPRTMLAPLSTASEA